MLVLVPYKEESFLDPETATKCACSPMISPLVDTGLLYFTAKGNWYKGLLPFSCSPYSPSHQLLKFPVDTKKLSRLRVDWSSQAPIRVSMANKDSKTPPTASAAIREEDVVRNAGLIMRAVETNTTRLTTRAISRNTPIRRRIQADVLCEALAKLFPEDSPYKAELLAMLAELPSEPREKTPTPGSSADSMEVEEPSSTSSSAPTAALPTSNNKDEKTADKPAAAAVAAAGGGAGELPTAAAILVAALPEVEVYLSTLVLTTLLRHGATANAVRVAPALLERAVSFNRRSLDPLAAKMVFYYSLSFEKAGRLPEARPRILALHRTCCLRHDEIGQATALNLLLRNLLSQNLLDQAYKLATKTNFPEACSNNQFCRYLYYMGRIYALQLDYTDAYTKLMQSSRKAPQNTAMGFQRAAQKLIIIVQLLLGEVPERAVFNQKGFSVALRPYLALTQAVRQGDLVEFNRVVKKYDAIFRMDKTFTLIQRLAHNVIKTGLRKINASYSRVSLQDLCEKVRLESVQSAEFVCAKAIRDGVIDAVIDHDKGWIRNQDVVDVYATDEPQQAFHKRITFCLDVHNEAVRAMRYPPNAYKKELESARLGLDDKTEEELAKEIEDEMDEDGL